MRLLCETRFSSKTTEFFCHINDQIRVQGYCCESGIVIIALKVTRNYAYSPFKITQLLLNIRFNPSGEEQDCENSRSKLKYGCSRTTDNIDNIVVYIKKVFVVYIHLHLLSTLRRYVLSISRRYLLCTTRRYLLSTSSCICCLH